MSGRNQAASRAEQTGERSPALPVWQPAVILLAGLLAYLSSFRGRFVFDDIPNILNNPIIRNWAFLGDMLASRRPLVTISLAINHSLGGFNEFGYHLFNLAIHLLAGLALYGVVRRTLLLDRVAEWLRTRAALLAFATALLWTVHPLTTQSVTYIIQRGESMMGLFFLLTLYCVIRGAKSSEPANWFALATIACGAGMASKAVMVMAPGVVFLYDRLFLADSTLETIRRRWGLYVALAATIGILVFNGVLTSVLAAPPEQPGRVVATVGFQTPGVDPMMYLLTQPGVILHYLRLSVLPTDLAIDKEWQFVRSITPGVLVSIGAVGLLVLATIWGTVKRRQWSIIGVWFFGILFPTSSFIPIRDAAYEHRMYLPLAAVVLAGVLLVWWAARRVGTAKGGAWRAAMPVILLLAVVLGALTYQRNLVYADRLTLWQDVIRKHPHAVRARINAAQALIERERFDEAETVLREALARGGDRSDVLLELGYAYAGQDRDAEAREAFRSALDLGLPGGGRAYAFQGRRLLDLGFPGMAERAFAEAVRRQPGNEVFHYWRGASIASVGEYERAIPHLEEARRLNPDYPLIYWTLGLAYEMTGDSAAAERAYRESIRLRPDIIEPYIQLANMVTEMGEYERAAEILAEAVERADEAEMPELYRRASYNLGNSYYRLGRYYDAIDAYERALQITPEHIPTLLQIAWSYYQLNLHDAALEYCRDILDIDEDNREVVPLYRQISAARRQSLISPDESGGDGQ